MALKQEIVFAVGNGEYGMDVSYVSAIEVLENVVGVPNAQSNILGIINLRGEVLPVYSLRKKFGLEEVPNTLETKIIVTKTKDVSVAYKVDMVKEIVDCTEDMVVEFPSIAHSNDTEFIENVLNIKGRLIILIDHNKLLKDDESKAITDMVDKLSDKDDQ